MNRELRLPPNFRARLKADYASTGEVLRANNIKLD
jgi:hypothetical protein